MKMFPSLTLIMCIKRWWIYNRTIESLCKQLGSVIFNIFLLINIITLHCSSGFDEPIRSNNLPAISNSVCCSVIHIPVNRIFLLNLLRFQISMKITGITATRYNLNTVTNSLSFNSPNGALVYQSRLTKPSHLVCRVTKK